MDLVKETILLHRNERMDSIEVRDRGRMVFYSYTYLYKSKYGDWRPLVRWDNFEKTPHVDKYDENRALLESKPTSEKKLDDVVKLANIFRRSLLAMELGDL